MHARINDALTSRPESRIAQLRNPSRRAEACVWHPPGLMPTSSPPRTVYTRLTDARGKPVTVQAAVNGDPPDVWVFTSVLVALAFLALGWLIGWHV